MTKMLKITRTLEKKVLKSLLPNKVLILFGPRRIGKTTLINQIIKRIKEPYLLLNGEDFAVQEILSRRTVANYKNLLGTKKILILDEAQNIPDIGRVLKLMVDEIKGIKILVTGSSAFDISNNSGEPLTGRKKTFTLFSLSEEEVNQKENPVEKIDNLRTRLIYGNYPELLHLNSNTEKTEYLKEIVNSYLLKDILAFENIRNSDKILKLLRLIALQVGSEVSLQELGTNLGMSKNTVEKYLDLLSKVFIVHKLEGFSRNLRKEISKNSKWYFYDNGLRNILIANVNPIELRNDIGMLWENYIISERLKYQSYNGMLVNNYFWRTYDQQEIDWIEERNGKLFAFEFKWKLTKKSKIPIAWKKNYPEAQFKLITQNNLGEFLNI